MSQAEGPSLEGLASLTMREYAMDITRWFGGTLVLLILMLMPVIGWADAELDYFTANEDEAAAKLLILVDKYHTDVVLKKLRVGDVADALEDAKYTLGAFPNYPRALMMMETIGIVRKTPSLAGGYYERALLLYPQYAFTHAQYGRYLVDVGQVEKGIASLNHALKLDSKLLSAYLWLAQAYHQKGNHDLAKQSLDRARALGYKGDLAGIGEKESSP
jgi:Tfp pilus assembly protein PilF